jgi:hypothetical protein
MKRFTAKDLNNKRYEIRKCVKEEGGCVIDYMLPNREVDFSAVMITFEQYEELADFYEYHHPKLKDIKPLAQEDVDNLKNNKV